MDIWEPSFDRGRTVWVCSGHFEECHAGRIRDVRSRLIYHRPRFVVGLRRIRANSLADG